jgi:hypothetical protein
MRCIPGPVARGTAALDEVCLPAGTSFRQNGTGSGWHERYLSEGSEKTKEYPELGAGSVVGGGRGRNSLAMPLGMGGWDLRRRFTSRSERQVCSDTDVRDCSGTRQWWVCPGKLSIAPPTSALLAEGARPVQIPSMGDLRSVGGIDPGHEWPRPACGGLLRVGKGRPRAREQTRHDPEKRSLSVGGGTAYEDRITRQHHGEG